MNESKPEVVIRYCCQCQWLLRAAWMAQELLSTFSDDLKRVSLEPATGGEYKIFIDGQLLWDRKQDGGFPDAKLIKQKVRNYAWPDKDLGHIDTP